MFAKLLPLLLLPAAFCAPVASEQQSNTLISSFSPLILLNTKLLQLNTQVALFQGNAQEASALESDVASAFSQINDVAAQISSGSRLLLPEAINLNAVVPNVVRSSLSLSRNLAKKAALIQDQGTKAQGWPLMQIAYQAVYNLDAAARSKVPVTYSNLINIQEGDAIASMTTIRNQFIPSGSIAPSDAVLAAAPPTQTGAIGALALPIYGGGHGVAVTLPTFSLGAVGSLGSLGLGSLGLGSFGLGSLFGQPRPRPAASSVPAPPSGPAFQPDTQYSTFQPIWGADGMQYQPVSQAAPQNQAPAAQSASQAQPDASSGYQPQGYTPAGR